MATQSTWMRCTGKAGVLGTLIGGIGCPACFPAVAALGGAVGLGFLSQWEGVLVRFLIPACATLVLLVNALGWRAHHDARRALLGCVGPLLALVGAFGLMGFFNLTHGFLPPGLARGAFYLGIAVMLLVGIADLFLPWGRVAQCEVPDADGSMHRGR